MHLNFYKFIEKYIVKRKISNVLFLYDQYFSNLPLEKNLSLDDLILLSKNSQGYKINFINEKNKLKEEKNKYDLIINLCFSSSYADQSYFFNKMLKLCKKNAKIINILPFYGFVNYGFYNFNPIFFKYLNYNNNFQYEEISFIDSYANKLLIKNEIFEKVFFQSTQMKNQSFVDTVFTQIKDKFSDCFLFVESAVLKTDQIQFSSIELERIGHHLSGHGNITHVDKGALKTILSQKKIHSFIDIGCGPGGMVSYVNSLGINALGVDGDNSIIRENIENIFIHDYTKGRLNIDKKFDLGWSVEFLEHVEEKYAENYFSTFKKCKYIFCTFAPEGKGGYHHVNTQNLDYWLHMFEKNSFIFNKNITMMIRENSTITKNFVRENGLFFDNTRFSE